MALGVANLKLCLVSGIKLVKCGVKVMADGKVGLGDIAVVLAALNELKALAGVDFKAVVPELTDLSVEEAGTLLQAALAELKA